MWDVSYILYTNLDDVYIQLCPCQTKISSTMPLAMFLWSVANCDFFYCMDLQSNSKHELPVLLTLNPPSRPRDTLYEWSASHPIPSVAASKASAEVGVIQGKRRLWFCGAYQGAFRTSRTILSNQIRGVYVILFADIIISDILYFKAVAYPRME